MAAQVEVELCYVMSVAVWRSRIPQDMAAVLSKAVMRWWPDEMVPQNRPTGAIEEARRLWEAMQLYEPFDITSQVAAKYGERTGRDGKRRRC